jgi:hypothetical protein
MNLPLGGKALVAGPTRNPNFPYVVLNRARYHRLGISQRTHAVQGELALTADPQTALEPLSGETRRELESVFAKLRRGKEDPGVTIRLAAKIENVFADDEKPRGEPML